MTTSPDHDHQLATKHSVSVRFTQKPVTRLLKTLYIESLRSSVKLVSSWFMELNPKTGWRTSHSGIPKMLEKQGTASSVLFCMINRLFWNQFTKQAAVEPDPGVTLRCRTVLTKTGISDQDHQTTGIECMTTDMST